MNDTVFSNSFHFNEIHYKDYHYTDNRRGSPSHYFAYMIFGNCKLVTDSETAVIKTGDFLYIPDKVPYQSYWYGNPEIKFISLGFKHLPNFENKNFTIQSISGFDEARRLFLSVANSKKLTAATVGEFYTLVGMLMPKMKYTMPRRTKEIVILAEKYLFAHPHAKNSEIAKHCAISEATLYAAFEKSSDLTPAQLRNGILLEKAKNLLITSDKPIEFISDSLMFSSPSYFRKKFKQFFGVTPREIRRINRI